MVPTNPLVSDPRLDPDNDDYACLPESIKSIYSRQEYLWLSEQQKADLIQQECEPEWG